MPGAVAEWIRSARRIQGAAWAIGEEVTESVEAPCAEPGLCRWGSRTGLSEESCPPTAPGAPATAGHGEALPDALARELDEELALKPGQYTPRQLLWVVDERINPRTDAVFTHGSVVLGSADGQSFWLLVTIGPRRGRSGWSRTSVPRRLPAADAWGFEEWVRPWHAGTPWWS